MSKVIIPKNCKECPKSNYGYKHFLCTQTGKDAVFDYIPDWCPFPDLPEKRNTTSLIETKHEAEENHVTPQHQAGFNLGWNACLDAITGGKET